LLTFNCCYLFGGKNLNPFTLEKTFITETPIKIKNCITYIGPRGHMHQHKVPRDTLLSNFDHYDVFVHNGSLYEKVYFEDTC
jgi:hypothetical protein